MTPGEVAFFCGDDSAFNGSPPPAGLPYSHRCWSYWEVIGNINIIESGSVSGIQALGPVAVSAWYQDVLSNTSWVTIR